MEDVKNPNPERYWRHRRWAFWSGLGFSALMVPIGLLVGYLMPAHVESLVVPLVSMGFWGGLAVAAMYVANCAVDEVANLRRSQ